MMRLFGSVVVGTKVDNSFKHSIWHKMGCDYYYNNMRNDLWQLSGSKSKEKRKLTEDALAVFWGKGWNYGWGSLEAGLYESPRATLMTDHTLSGLRQHTLTLLEGTMHTARTRYKNWNCWIWVGVWPHLSSEDKM